MKTNKQNNINIPKLTQAIIGNQVTEINLSDGVVPDYFSSEVRFSSLGKFGDGSVLDITTLENNVVVGATDKDTLLIESPFSNANYPDKLIVSGCKGMNAVVALQGQQFASLSGDGIIRIWDLANISKGFLGLGNHQPIKELPLTKMPKNFDHVALDVTPDKRYLLSLFGGFSGAVISVFNIVNFQLDKVIKLEDSLTGMFLHSSNVLNETLKIINNEVCVLAVNRSGQEAGKNHIALIYNFKTDNHLGTLIGHTDSIRAINVTADFKNIITAAKNGEVKIWDTETFGCLQTLTHHGDAVNSILVAQDGSLILGGEKTFTVEKTALSRTVTKRRQMGPIVKYEKSKVGGGEKYTVKEKRCAVTIWRLHDLKVGAHLENVTYSNATSSATRCLTTTITGLMGIEHSNSIAKISHPPIRKLESIDLDLIFKTLKSNESVESINLSNLALDEKAVAKLIDILKINKTTKSIDLGGIKISDQDAIDLMLLLINNTTLEQISFTPELINGLYLKNIELLLQANRIKMPVEMLQYPQFNNKTSLEDLEKFAAKDICDAQYWLANRHIRLGNQCEKEINKSHHYNVSFLWHYHCALKFNEARSMLSIAELYEAGKGIILNKGKHSEEALYWYEKACTANVLCPAKVTSIGREFYFGLSGYKQDYTEAVKWYKKANTKESYYMLGLCYLQGSGVAQNLVEAFNNFKLAGNYYAPALFAKSYCYEKGIGVAVDSKASEKCSQSYEVAKKRAGADELNLIERFKKIISSLQDIQPPQPEEVSTSSSQPIDVENTGPLTNLLGLFAEKLKLSNANLPITKELMATLKGHNSAVNAICYIEAHNIIVSASLDATIKLWDITKDQCIDTLKGHQGGIQTLYLMNASTLVSGGIDGLIKVWDIPSRSCLKTMKDENAVRTLCAMTDGSIISAGLKGIVKLWDVKSEESATVLRDENDIYAICMMGANLVAIASDKKIKLLDLNIGKVVSECVEGHQEVIWSLCKLNDNMVASGSWDNTIKLWDIYQGKCMNTFNTSSHIYSLYKLNEDTIVSGHKEGQLQFWDIQRGTEITSLQGDAYPISALCKINDYTFVSGSGGDDNKIKIWDVKSCLRLTKEFMRNVM